MDRKLLAGLLCAALPLPARAQAPTPVPPGTPVTIVVKPAEPAVPPVSITLGARHGHAYPARSGLSHTGGGNIDVAQPSPDTVVVTMTGVAVAAGCPTKGANAAMTFDLDQCLEISFDKPEVKKAKLTIEGRVIGLLRSHCKGDGSASTSGGCATVTAGAAELVTLCVPDHSVAGGENLALNDREGPISVPVVAGKYALHQRWQISASAARTVLPCKAPSAEFAPDPALDPLWISYWEPFHGAAKKDFGFQITIKVADDTAAAANGAAPAATTTSRNTLKLTGFQK
jgi:hypothetical protein